MTQIKAKQIGDFTSAVRNQLVAGTGISISSGTIATTITQYTDLLAKTAAVVNSTAGAQTDQAPSVSAMKSYVSTLQSDMTTAQSDISTLQSDVSTAQSDILSVQAKTLYSNSYYVNDGVNDIQTVLDGIAGSSGVSAIYMSVGSYGGSTVTISNHANVNILAPESPTGVHGCELLSRGLTISGASTTRIKIENLNIEGAFLINGTQGRHYFKNVIFDSTVTINNACANFITFEQCSFAGGISIASNVTATVYFDRCNLGNQLITSSRSGAGSPLLTILTECSGVNALQTNLTSNVALVGRTGFNSGLVVQYQNSDSYVYDLNNGLSTSFSGSYSELRNKPTIPTSSDDLTEGSTNLFYTNSRFDTRLATKTTDNLTQGSTNLYFTNSLAKTAAVVNSMAGTQTDQAPSVSSVKAYYTAGTGISLTGGTIASTITQYTDELAQDASASLLTTGTHTGINYSYVDGSNKIDSTVSLAGFSIDALSDVDTSTTPPTSGQALAWDGTSKWIPTTIGGAGGGNRPSYTTASLFPLTISAPASSVIKERYYLDNGTTAVTVNLPAVASCDGLEIVIKLLGTGTATIDASGSETIDGALTFALTLQNSSVNLIATSAGWRIE